MKKAFISESGVLVAWGYAESNNDDTMVEVDDDFGLEPGKWKLNSSGKWTAYAPPELVPASVTMRQAKLALIEAGKFQAVESAIAAMSGTDKLKAQVEWGGATAERSSPTLIQLAAAIGLDSDALDALFIAAAKL